MRDKIRKGRARHSFGISPYAVGSAPLTFGAVVGANTTDSRFAGFSRSLSNLRMRVEAWDLPCGRAKRGAKYVDEELRILPRRASIKFDQNMSYATRARTRTLGSIGRVCFQPSSDQQSRGRVKENSIGLLRGGGNSAQIH